MAITGFICHDDYLAKTSKLTDEQVGRLFRALMTYHATGEEIKIDGIESVAFDFIREDIDRAEQAYKEKCETNRRNRLSTNNNVRQRSSTSVAEKEQSSTNVHNNKNKNNNKIKEDNKIIFIDDDNARLIQSEQNRILDAAKDAGFKLTNNEIASLISLYADSGLEKVLDGINSCSEHSAPNLAYLRAVLKGEPKKPKPKVNAQDYSQRDYDTVTDELMQDQIRDMEEFMQREGKT